MEAVSEVVPQKIRRGPNTRATSTSSSMNRTAKRLLLFAVLLGLFTVVRFPYESLLEDELELIKKRATLHGIFFEVDNTSIRFPGRLTFDRFGALIATQNLPIPLVLTKGKLSLDLLPFVLLRAQLSATAKAYQGEIESVLTRSLLSDEYSFELEGSALNLNEHPSLKAVGVSGTANIQVEGSAELEQMPSEAKVNLSIKSGAFNYTQPIAGVFKIPPLSSIDADIELAATSGRLTFEQCQAKTSHGSISCNGSANLDAQGRINTADVTLELALNDSGRADFGPYLALASGQQSNSGRGVWKIDLLLSGGVITNFGVTPG